MSFTLIAAVVLSFAGTFNIGLAASATGEQVQAEFGDVLVQEEPPTLTKIPGKPEDPVEEAVPDLVYQARLEDYNRENPDLLGVFMSFNILKVAFALGVTVEEANAILAEVDAEIVGGRPGFKGKVGGLLILRFPTQTHAELKAMQTFLEAKPEVDIAGFDVGMGIPFDPEEPEDESTRQR